MEEKMRSESSVTWWSYLYAMTVSALFLLVVSAPSARGQTVIAILPLGGGQGFYSMAVNPVTNKIYVANGSNLTVIDGATNSTVTIPGAGGALAVNSATNKIYSCTGSNLTVIDGATNSITTVSGAGGGTLEVNPVTNKIYVSGTRPDRLTVVDGATNSTVTIPGVTGRLAVNSVTNKIYVLAIVQVSVNNWTGHVVVIDGATNSTTAT